MKAHIEYTPAVKAHIEYTPAVKAHIEHTPAVKSHIDSCALFGNSSNLIQILEGRHRLYSRCSKQRNGAVEDHKHTGKLWTWQMNQSKTWCSSKNKLAHRGTMYIEQSIGVH